MSNLNIIATELEKSLGGPPDVIPKGFRRRQDWEIIWNLKRFQTQAIINQRIREGRMEMKAFRQFNNSRQRQTMPFYRAIK